MSLHTLQSGSSGETIIFIHGFPMNGHIWDAQLSALAAGFKCYALDLPGYGLSPTPDGFIASMDSYADHVAQFIAARGLPLVHIVGISLGGMIALNFARRHGHLLKSIILLHSTASTDTAELKDGRTQIIEDIKQGGLKEFVVNFADILLGPTAGRAVRADYITLMNDTSKDTVIAGMKALRDRGAELQNLGNIDIPTLVVAGDQDTRTPAQMMEKIAAALPNSTFEIITGCGHVSPIEQPDKLSGLIRDWVSARA